MIEKYRVHEVAKDLGVASKEVVDLLAANFQGERKSMTALNEQELSVIFNHYTNQNQVESFDEYFAAGRARKEAAQEAARQAAEAAMRLMEAFFERRTYLKKYVVALRVMACPIQKIKGRSRWQVTLQIVDQPICQEAVGKMSEIAAAPAAGCLCVCQINPSSMM